MAGPRSTFPPLDPFPPSPAGRKPYRQAVCSVIGYAAMIALAWLLIAVTGVSLRRTPEPKVERVSGPVEYVGADLYLTGQARNNTRYERIFIRLKGDNTTYRGRCDQPISTYCRPHDANAEASLIREPQTATLTFHNDHFVGLSLDGETVITPPPVHVSANLQLAVILLPTGFLVLWGGLGLLAWLGRLGTLVLSRPTPQG